MAKKKSGGGIDFKKVLLEKGERYGFYVAGGLLVLFLALGGLTAAKSESSGSIVKDFDSKTAAVEQKINQASGTPVPPIDSVVYQDSTVPRIPFTLYSTHHPIFDITRDERTKRVNPRILPPTEAQVEFVRGSVGVYMVTQENGKTMIGVLKN